MSYIQFKFITGTAESSDTQGMLKDFVPVPVFNERTLEKMKKMERRRKRGLVVYYCKECNFATPDKFSLVQHSRTHSGERPFECGICDDKFRQKGNLTQHLLTHQEGRFECDQCDYKSTTKGALVIHQRRHTGERPFSCTDCSYKTVSGSILTVHMRKHTGVKPYACSHCSYTSAQKGSLERHKLTHSGAKPFSCDYCPFKTAQKSSLTRHLKVCKHAPGPSMPL